jgi:hypothetical protein
VYQFSFDVFNPAEAQAAASVSIEAFGSVHFERASVTVPHQTVVGVLNGSDPMLVERPQFLVRDIAQTIPFARYDNTFFVTLMSNVDLANKDGSVVTITGLEGAEGPSTIHLITPAGGNQGSDLFCNGNISRKGTALYSDGTVILHLRDTLRAHVPYIISFTLFNPSGNREVGPVVRISATGTAKFHVQTFRTPNQKLYGVENGTNPMVQVDTNFELRDTFQTSPIADLLNTITVIFSPSIDLGEICVLFSCLIDVKQKQCELIYMVTTTASSKHVFSLLCP